MDDIAELLNYDVIGCIKKQTCNVIKTDCKVLVDFFKNEKASMPTEPPTGKSYYIWINYMLNYTKNIVPIEDSINIMYDKIIKSNDFDELQDLYTQFKNLIDEWYDLKTRFRYSDYFRY